MSVTQKISAVEHYDQIIVLMQGEIVASGKHDELMHTSPEYVQIFNSQQSTSNYENNTINNRRRRNELQSKQTFGASRRKHQPIRR